MLKLNIKPNLRQFLTDKVKTQLKTTQNIKNPRSNKSSSPNYNFTKPLNQIKPLNQNQLSNPANLNLVINALKDKKDKKTRTNNNINTNSNLFNDCNNFRKSKTTDKTSLNNIGLLMGYQENQSNNNNKKIIIKQNSSNQKQFTINVTKIPRYDFSSFKQVLKYYTIKSESKTIQIEELSSYLRPMRNILGIGFNNNKTKIQNNISSKIVNNLIHKEKDKDKTTINNELSDNENNIAEDDKYNVTFGKNNSSSIIKNCIFNNNGNTNKISYTQRSNKIPFNLKIEKIGNKRNFSSKKENPNKIKINNFVDNEKEEDKNDNEDKKEDNDDNNNEDKINKNTNTEANKESQILYQFRTRKINIPKTGINLSSMNIKNQILQNILSKRNKKIKNN